MDLAVDPADPLECGLNDVGMCSRIGYEYFGFMGNRTSEGRSPKTSECAIPMHLVREIQVALL